MSIYTSPAMITICNILSSKGIPLHLSSPVEEERNSLAGRRSLRSEDHGVFARSDLPTCRSQRRRWWSDISARMQPFFTSSKSQLISDKTSDRSPGELPFRHD